jgi:hypothetical protein
LANVLRVHPGAAVREVRLADQVAELPATAAGLAAGAVPAEAAALIADTDAVLAAHATAAQRRDAEALLAGQAQLLDHRALQHAAVHLRHVLDPDHGDRVAAEEQHQVARRSFRLRAQPDGSARADGYLDKEAAVTLRTALDPLTKPRPGVGGERDPRTFDRRMADALVELAEIAMRADPSGGGLPLSAGQPVQVVVTTRLSDLQTALTRRSPGELDLGLPLSAAAARRLACDAQVIPAVLGTTGEALDIGRGTRVVPHAIRRALVVRDRHCAFPGCRRPPRWCHAHHRTHWADGGPTCLDNLVLLCPAHHRAVHHDGWDVVLGPDRLPDFLPPAWIDPGRRPRRNLRLAEPEPP